MARGKASTKTVVYGHFGTAEPVEEPITFPGPTIESTCKICGATFTYAKPKKGRRRRFCSAECKQEQGKLNLRRYAAEDRYGRRKAAFEAREAKRGPLLPFDGDEGGG